MDVLLRVGGMLSNSSLAIVVKHLIILPKDSEISRLMIKEIQRNIGLLGKNTILRGLDTRGFSFDLKYYVKICPL